jgi:hypothetical protein
VNEQKVEEQPANEQQEKGIIFGQNRKQKKIGFVIFKTNGGFYCFKEIQCNDGHIIEEEETFANSTHCGPKCVCPNSLNLFCNRK